MTIRAAIVGLGLFCLAACGGSSSNGGPGSPWSPATLSGTYWLAVIDTDGAGESTWGTATSDGVSVLSLLADNNDEGVISMGGMQELRYTIAADGTLTIIDPVDMMPVAQGGISADGRRAVLSTATTMASPFLVVLLKTSGTFSDASLSGDYHWSRYSLSPAGSLYDTKITCDGMGAYTGTGAVNTVGALDGGAVMGTYAVAADGAAEFGNFGQTAHGCLAAGSDLALFGGGDTAGNVRALHVLMEAGTGMDDADLQGSYWFAGIEYSVSGAMFGSFYGSFTADGAGDASVVGTSFDGSALAPLLGSPTYSVATDGTVVVNRSGVMENLTGGMTPDGRFFAVGGGALASSNTVLIVFCRKQ